MSTTYLEAIREGLWEEMERDPNVFLIGEDIGVYGGAFKVTAGFIERVEGVGLGTIDCGGAAGGLFGEAVVEAVDGQLFQSGDSRGHRQRIAGERACLVDRAQRSDVVHEFGAAAEGCQDRKSTRLNSSHLKLSRMPSSA